MGDAIPVDSGVPQRHPSTTGLLRWFEYEHLPTELGVVSMQFHHLAHELVDRLPDSPELSVALRKLLEGKDAAVRAAIESGTADQLRSRPQPEARYETRAEFQRELTFQEQADRAAAHRSATEQSGPLPAGPEYVTPEAAVAREVQHVLRATSPGPDAQR